MDLPLTFLVDCSHESLTQYELSRLAEVANLRKQIRVMTEQMVNCLAAANAARWLLENRQDLCRTVITLRRDNIIEEALDLGGCEERETSPETRAPNRFVMDAD